MKSLEMSVSSVVITMQKRVECLDCGWNSSYVFEGDEYVLDQYMEEHLVMHAPAAKS